MSWVSIDIEADGACPGLFSMISFGAVIIDERLDKTFYGELRPLDGAGFNEEALKVSGHTHEQTLLFPDSLETMKKFDEWLSLNSKPRHMFISDNNGFDWQFINYYFHRFIGRNPFGFGSTNLGSLFKGMKKDMRVNFKFLRDTRHTHNPVDDSVGNAEAFVKMVNDYGLRL